MTRGLATVLSVCTLLSIAPALFAQNTDRPDVDCTDPQTQMEMTFCAGKDLEAADRALNDAYARAVEVARGKDADGHIGSAVPITGLLREAQRAWIPFRDAACDLEATTWGGGTGQSMAYLQCKTRLTERRTEDLRLFGEFPK